jgi:murein DD-endopeptidase MepM/ murein hydrolase activator NlpD
MSDTPLINPLVGMTPGVSATGVSGDGRPTAEQIRTLAAEFESVLLSQMLRQMRSSMLDDDEDEASGFGDGPLSDVMTSQLGIALARAGGIGLAGALATPLTAEAAADGASATTGLTMPAAFSPAMGASSTPALGSTLTPVMAASGADTQPVTLAGRLSSAYGWRRDPINGTRRFHKGIDVAMPVGQSVPAARDGRVTFAGEMRGYGLAVVIDHGHGLSTRYGHLSAIDVQAGDTVTAGQTIAESGSTGRSTGPHLHFEVLDNGQPVNPMVSWARLGGEGGSS